jgi:hypothetical protein
MKNVGVKVHNACSNGIDRSSIISISLGRWRNTPLRRRSRVGAAPRAVVASSSDSAPLGDGLLKAYNAVAEAGSKTDLPRESPIGEQLALRADEFLKAATSIPQLNTGDGQGDGLLPSATDGALQVLTALWQEIAREADLVQERFGPVSRCTPRWCLKNYGKQHSHAGETKDWARGSTA